MNRYIPDQRSILSYFGEISTSAPLDTTTSDPIEICDIYCDGSCHNNGRRGARAGYGVAVFLNGTETTVVAASLGIDELQTNQRAELKALCVAVEHATKSTADIVRIYSDSEYVINCLTRWAPTGRRSGWRKADGGSVLHRDLIEPLLATWDTLRGRAQIRHVMAHTGRNDMISRGNERADALARAAVLAALNQI